MLNGLSTRCAMYSVNENIVLPTAHTVTRAHAVSLSHTISTASRCTRCCGACVLRGPCIVRLRGLVGKARTALGRALAITSLSHRGIYRQICTIYTGASGAKLYFRKSYLAPEFLDGWGPTGSKGVEENRVKLTPRRNCVSQTRIRHFLWFSLMHMCQSACNIREREQTRACCRMSQYCLASRCNALCKHRDAMLGWCNAHTIHARTRAWKTCATPVTHVCLASRSRV